MVKGNQRLTHQGGANGDGNIFSINTDGSDFQNLLSFSGANEVQCYELGQSFAV